jgi:hypothetical protein
MARDKERIRREQSECAEYIRRAGNIPAARQLAKDEDNKTYSTSDWLGGLSSLLK